MKWSIRLLAAMLTAGTAVAITTPVASAATTVIGFESFNGPMLFTQRMPPLTIGVATFSGGQILTNTAGLPADETSVYGTAAFCDGCGREIVIQFSRAVSNVAFLLLNGQTYDVTYTTVDNVGDRHRVTLHSNSQSGAATVNLRSSGIRTVAVSSNADQWDFFIDNVSFHTEAACTVTGTARGDFLVGTDRADRICAGGGNDTVDARGGDDVVDGGAGNDFIIGRAGADHLYGGAGNDDIDALDGSGTDVVDGGPGYDVCRVDRGDRVRGCEVVTSAPALAVPRAG
ncbi:MAG: calcium-binding protein [Mycobacteriales bacterium]